MAAFQSNRFVRAASVAALALAPTLVMAQTPAVVPDQTIGQAGAALHDVAKLQKQYQAKMDAASPDRKNELGAQANAEAVQVIQSHGISVQQYSHVVNIAQNNPEVRQRLLEAARKGE